MKVATSIREAHGLDTRARDASRSPPDANDGNARPFDDVLSGVGGDQKAPTEGKASQSDGSGEMPAAASVAVPPSDGTIAGTAAPGAVDLDALIDAFGKGGSPADPAAPLAVGARTTAGVQSTNALAKQASTDEDVSQTQSATPGAPTDFMAMLLAGAGAVMPPAPAAGSSSGAAQKPSTTKGSDNAVAPPTDDTTQTATVIVSDISVSTHLAPVTARPADARRDDPANDAGKAFLQDVPKAAPDVSPEASSEPVQKKGATSGVGTIDASITPLETAFGPTHTIAKAIGDLAAAPQSASSAPSADNDVTKPFVSVARTLNLKMSPESLGTVDIRLHVSGQSLDVELTVSSAQTLGIVSRDRDALSSALRDQNYQVNSLVIQDGGAAASSGGNNATQDGQTSGSGQRHDGGSSSGGSSARDGERQGQGTQQSSRDGRPPRSTPSSPAADESGRALFV